MKKHVRLDHKQLSTARPRPQQMCWRGNSRWALVAALCIVTFLGMLGIASAAQHSGGPLTLAQKEQRIQQLLNAGRAHLRPKPTTPQVPSPQSAPTLHAGIINMQQGPFGGSLFAVNNFWQGPVGSNWELVYAGAERNPDGSVKQGALKLYTKDLTPIGTYPAPSGAGALTIIAVKGSLMQLRTDTGSTLVFNLQTNQYTYR